jgi:hypothetical protein
LGAWYGLETCQTGHITVPEPEQGNDGWEPIVLEFEPSIDGWVPPPKDHEDPPPNTGMIPTAAQLMLLVFWVFLSMRDSLLDLVILRTTSIFCMESKSKWKFCNCDMGDAQEKQLVEAA